MANNFCNIFYTDDDRDDQEIFKDALSEVSENSSLLVQNNGDELMRLLQNPPLFPNLLFLDLNMPVKNGYQVLKELKQTQYTRDLPVIVFTTSNDAVSIETSRSLGASLYVSKPLTFSSLKKILKDILAIDWKTFTASTEEFVYRIN